MTARDERVTAQMVRFWSLLCMSLRYAILARSSFGPVLVRFGHCVTNA